MQPLCAAEHIVLSRAGAGNDAPMAVCGHSGEGRYLAWGLAIGISKEDDSDIPPTEDEGVFLVNAVKWCAGADQ